MGQNHPLKHKQELYIQQIFSKHSIEDTVISDSSDKEDTDTNLEKVTDEQDNRPPCASGATNKDTKNTKQDGDLNTVKEMKRRRIGLLLYFGKMNGKKEQELQNKPFQDYVNKVLKQSRKISIIWRSFKQ